MEGRRLILYSVLLSVSSATGPLDLNSHCAPSPHLASRMNVLDEVPFKIPLGPLEGPQDKVELVTAPELTTLDREKIFLETKVRTP